MIRTAVILAAGKGTRFGERTKHHPKSFVKLGNTSMIVRSLDNLIKSGITEIIIGTGYKFQFFEELQKDYPIKCVNNEEYNCTNSIYTLYKCKELINEDFILLESDIVYDSVAITVINELPYKDVFLTVPPIKFQDSYFVEIDKNQFYKKCTKNKYPKTKWLGEWTGINKMSLESYQKICQTFQMDIDKYKMLHYEDFIGRFCDLKIYVYLCSDITWYEIDDEKDLAFAQKYIEPFLS